MSFKAFSLTVHGLTCGSCIKTLTGGLKTAYPTCDITVTLTSAVVSGFDCPEVASIIEEIEDLGFEVYDYGEADSKEEKGEESRERTRTDAGEKAFESFTFSLKGLTCGHCIKTVTEAVKAFAPSSSIDVSLTSATVEGFNLPSAGDIAEEIEDVGFEVEGWKDKSGNSSPSKSGDGEAKSSSASSKKKGKSSDDDAPCGSCGRKNCPCGEFCECGTMCTCVASDVRDAIAKTDASPTMVLKTINLLIDGMSCTNCSQAVTKIIKGVKGVVEADVNAVTGKGVVKVDSKAMDVTEMEKLLAEKVANGGYPCRVIAGAGGGSGGGCCDGDDEEGGDGGLQVCKVINTHVGGNDVEEGGGGLELSQIGVDSAGSSIIEGVIKVTNSDDKKAKEFTYDPSITGPRSILKALGNDWALAPSDRELQGQLQREEMKRRVKEHLNAFLLSLIGTLPVFLISMILGKVDSITFLKKMIVPGFNVEALILWVLTTPVQFISGWPFYVGTYHGIRNGLLGMDVLISLGTTAAYVYAVITIIVDINREKMTMGYHFFETSAVLISFVLLGKYLQILATRRTSQALDKLMKLTPKTAKLITCSEENPTDYENGLESEIEVDLLQRGDVLKIIRGASVPSDGVLVGGSISVDEAMITGESLPVLKVVGSETIGGTVSVEGVGYMRCTAVGSDSMLNQICNMIESAQGSKVPVQAYADKISNVFVPVVVTLSVLSFLVWIILCVAGVVPEEWYEENGQMFFSLMFGIATLVIACPCALGLAVPTAVMVGTGVGAREGILIKGGEALQITASVNAVVFDKTGTLTIGKPTVTDFVRVGASGDAGGLKDEKLHFYLGCAEKSSEHPLGVAMVNFAVEKLGEEGKDDKIYSPSTFKAVTGKGISCEIDDVTVSVGNRAFMILSEITFDDSTNDAMKVLEDAGKTAVLLAVGKTVEAIVGISDKLKPESKATIEYLRKKLKVDVWMVTGDNTRTAKAIGALLELPEKFIVAEALPATKVNKVTALQKSAKNPKVVMMVGDGINDSPALVQADVGVGVATGTEIAVEAADMVLVNDRLSDVITAIDLSKKIFSRIKLNFFWALGYNSMGLPVAAGLFYPLVQTALPPTLAALAMALSSVSVVLSSLALKFYRPPTIKID